MSSVATAWAWQQRVGKNKMLLLALADLADDRGCTRTPIDTLAEMIDRDRSTVIRQLQELEADGLIEREHQKAKGGIQLISRTRLVMGAAMQIPAAGSQNATPPQKTPISTPSQNATRTADASGKAGSQNATHKGKDPSSLLGITSLTSNNNTSAPDSPSTPEGAVQVVDAAGLRQVWQNWVRLGKLARVTQEVQIVQWAAWVQEGRTDALRAEAQRIIELGGYAHPFAGLKARMNLAAEGQKGSAAPGTSSPEPLLRPGERRRAPDGQVWTVECVEYGVVYFAEPHAPLDMGEALVARWPLEGGEA